MEIKLSKDDVTSLLVDEPLELTEEEINEVIARVEKDLREGLNEYINYHIDRVVNKRPKRSTVTELIEALESRRKRNGDPLVPYFIQLEPDCLVLARSPRHNAHPVSDLIAELKQYTKGNPIVKCQLAPGELRDIDVNKLTIYHPCLPAHLHFGEREADE